MPTSRFDKVPSSDALSPETANAIDFAAIPAGVTLSSDNIERLSERTAETAQAFARRLENLQAAFGEARERYGRDAQETIDSAAPDARKAARTFAKSQEATRINMMRRNLVSNSVKERGELHERLARFAAEAEFLSSLCATPEMMLGRVALGDTKRTAYMQQLDGAGPVELETAARTAIATGDIVLAASIGTSWTVARATAGPSRFMPSPPVSWARNTSASRRCSTASSSPTSRPWLLTASSCVVGPMASPTCPWPYRVARWSKQLLRRPDHGDVPSLPHPSRGSQPARASRCRGQCRR